MSRRIVLVAGAVTLLLVMLLLLSSPSAPAASSSAVDAVGAAAPEWLAASQAFISTNRTSSAYTHAQFTPEALANSTLLPVTAVLLSWKRVESLQFVVSFLQRYPFIREIIVWNNNPDLALSIQNFTRIDQGPKLRVFDSAANIQDMAKYTTCGALATYDTCYIQDDDWLPAHLDTLYASYVLEPTRIHTNTMPMIHIEHRRWTFTDDTIGLHAGFAWLGCGSFIPRRLTQRFIDLVGRENFTRDTIRVIDMYFAIFTNRYVTQLINTLHPLSQNEGWSDRSDAWDIVYGNMLDAAKRIQKRLVDGSWAQIDAPSELDSGVSLNEAELFLERHVRAPCYTDRCLFITNMDPFPAPSAVRFDPNVASIDEHQQKFYAVGYPSNSFWEKSSYNLAVDGDSATCWSTYKAGDFFGLYQLHGAPVSRLRVKMSTALLNDAEKIYVEVSDDGRQWARCHNVTSTTEHILNDVSVGVIAANCAELGVSAPQWVRVALAHDMTESLRVCDLEVVAAEAAVRMGDTT